MSASVTFDHLAIGVRSWEAGFRRFASELGGRWSHGGDAGEFAPCQLLYPGGIAVELISPGGAPDGFMRRFIERSGPGPHHITFRVSSLDAVLTEISALRIGILEGGMRLPFRQEAFLHPKQSGLGTLLQLVQWDDTMPEAAHSTPPPACFPPARDPAGAPARSVAWAGITVESLNLARELFTGALHGTVTERGPGWLRVSWGPGRDLLVRSGAALPAGAALWGGQAPGLAHMVFALGQLAVGQLESGHARAERMSLDEATGIPVWLVPDAAPGRAR
jgi:methylmalonyl-CoA/ethylmalonyl-CoA epimerase